MRAAVMHLIMACWLYYYLTCRDVHDGPQVGSCVIVSLVDRCVLCVYRLAVRKSLCGGWGCTLIKIRLRVV